MIGCLCSAAWAARPLIAVRPATNPSASVTPEWECVPTTVGAAMTYGGSGAAPSCSGKAVLAPTYESSGVGGKPTVEFSGVNVQIVDGSGFTSTVNGTGNLILGYDETPGAQTGSHDLISGEDQTSTGYGNLVGGYGNNVTGDYATAAGYFNTASGSFSVAGGDQNTVSGSASTVLGGYHNTVSSNYSSLTGGCSNLVGTGTVTVPSYCSNTTSFNHDFSSIGGGSGNQATGISSAVIGGQFNQATDPFAVVAGGCGSLAGTGTPPNPNCDSTGVEAILGGDDNQASAQFAVAAGGCDNLAGAGNPPSSLACTETADAQAVLGGYQNQAEGTQASVTGGGDNHASDTYASVTGGEVNTASGLGASVTGGELNTASGDGAAVSGGENNTASGGQASVSGGNYNTAFNGWGSILGGCSNYAGTTTPDTENSICTDSTDDPGDFDSVAGGVGNQAQAIGSSILGGYSETLNAPDYSQAGATAFNP
jgi:hypothetical protein